MVLYLNIIFISWILLSFFDIIIGAYNLSAWAVIGYVGLAIFISFAIDALCAIIIRLIKPEKFNPFCKFFGERKNERKFYEKLKIRKWKDVIPELGKTLKFFDKTEVESNPNSEYMLKFLRETCYAEIMHAIGIVFSFLVLVIMPSEFIWGISLPVLIVNIFLQILPIMVQRYTRPKLVIAYKRLKKKENLEQKQREENSKGE